MNPATPQTQTQVHFTTLQPEHVEGALHCLAQSFMDEPILKTIQLPYEALRDFLRPRIELTAQDGLSVVAVENGKVVSAILSDDNTLEHVPYPNEGQWAPQLAPVLELLSQLHEGSAMEQDMLAQGLRFYHLFFAGTLPEGRNKGYVNRLMALSLEIARTKGFQVAMVEATSPGSQHTCRKFGYTLAHRICYQDVLILSTLGQAGLELYLLRL